MSNIISPTDDKKVMYIIIALSILVPSLVAALLLAPQTGKLGNFDVSMFPHINAILNSGTAVCLISGLIFIKMKREAYHRAAMITALVLSVFFLVFYVVYHFQAPSTRFPGDGAVKVFYLLLLLTHIILAAIVVPLVLFAFYFAIARKIPQHRKVVKFAYPIWLYVAVSGVLVYLMISPYYPQ